MTRQRWTDAEIQLLRDQFPKLTAAEIVTNLGRHTLSSLYQMPHRLGLSKNENWRRPAEGWEAVLAQRHAEQWSDAEIAAELNIERRYLRQLRTRLGLPANGNCQRRRDKVAAKTREQCDRFGVTSVGALRGVVLMSLAPKHGWPYGLRARAVHILELLFQEWPVPLTRKQIADGIGMPWKGSRKSLVSNDPEGSYLAHLAARGLVVRSPRTGPVGTSRRGNGQGCGVCLYTLTTAARELKHSFLLTQKDQTNGETPSLHVADAVADDHRIGNAAPPAHRDRNQAHRRVPRKDRRSVHRQGGGG